MLLTVFQFDSALLVVTACVYVVAFAAAWAPAFLAPKPAIPRYVKSALLNTIFMLSLYAGLTLLLALTGGFTYRASVVMQINGVAYAFLLLDGVLLVSSVTRLIRTVGKWQRWKQEHSPVRL